MATKLHARHQAPEAPTEVEPEQKSRRPSKTTALLLGLATVTSLTAGVVTFGNRSPRKVAARSVHTATATPHPGESPAPSVSPPEQSQTAEGPTSPGLHTADIPAGAETFNIPRPDGTTITLGKVQLYNSVTETVNVLFANVAAIAITGNQTVINNFTDNPTFQQQLPGLYDPSSFNFQAFPHTQDSIFGDPNDPPVFSETTDADGNTAIQLQSGQVLLAQYVGGPGKEAIWQGSTSHIASGASLVLDPSFSVTFDQSGNISDGNIGFTRNPNYVPGPYS